MDYLYMSIQTAYDIVAVQPTTDKMFLQACTQLKVDIITIDLSKKLNFNLKIIQVAEGLCI